MKKYVIGIIIGTLISSSVFAVANTPESFTALKATFPVFVGGSEFKSNDKPVVVINRSTYMPLKAIGEVLDKEIKWNEQLKRVDIGETPKTGEIITFSNITTKVIYDKVTIIGEVKNNDSTQHSLSATVTFYDVDKRILGTAFIFVKELKSGEAKTFETTSLYDFLTFDSYKIQTDTIY